MADIHDENEQHMLIQNLHHQNPQNLIMAFLQNHNGAVGSSFHTVINFAKKNNIRGFIQYIGSSEFRQAFVSIVKKHKWKIFFISLGILLLCNPVALVGFGALGPVAGSLAAAWQASMGVVAAGSTFAILQGIGMTCFIGIPVLGAVITSLTIAWAAWGDRLRQWWRWLTGQDNSDGEDDGHDHVD